MNRYKLRIMTSLLIFGSIGIFVKHIPLPANQIVLTRGLIGGLILTIFVLHAKKITLKERHLLKENLSLLLLSGFFLGLNWFFLYEAFQYISVSLATILYYLAPILVVALSPLILKEHLTPDKIIALVFASVGLIIITGITGAVKINMLGFFYAILAAIFYAAVVFCNQKIKQVDSLILTTVQILVAALIMLIYVGVTFKGLTPMAPKEFFMLLVLCFVHTALACYLYFSAMSHLSGQTVALLSYVDPLSALMFSAVFLGDRLSLNQWLGVLLIVTATLIPEANQRLKKHLFPHHKTKSHFL